MISFAQHWIIIQINRIKIKYDYFTIAVITICSIVFSQTFTACILCAVLHEAGHAVMLLHFGCDTLEIRLRLMCLDMIDNGRMKRSPAEHAVCILAGPLINFLCIPIFYALYKAVGSQFLLMCIRSSAALGFFNIMPLTSTDGGELLALLLEKFISPQKAQHTINIITLISIAAVVYYFVTYQQSKLF